jgi:hypothetical protein
MKIIITENQHNELVFKYMTLTIWGSVRQNIEWFHNDKNGTSELSQDDMKNFNIKIKKLIYDFCVDRNGIKLSNSPELSKLIINSIPDMIGKVINKRHFLNCIKSGVKSGIDGWLTYGKTLEGIKVMMMLYSDTPFDI